MHKVRSNKAFLVFDFQRRMSWTINMPLCFSPKHMSSANDATLSLSLTKLLYFNEVLFKLLKLDASYH